MIKKSCLLSHSNGRQSENYVIAAIVNILLGGAVINETPPSESYNLPFVLAYAVLDQVLAELINEGTFQCAGRAQLGGRMEASKNVLPWQNYKHITNGRNDRNDLAHEAKLLDKNKCFEYIDAIETELKAWGVL